VGFHLGEDEVTFDINAPLTREQLDLVEEKANEAVFKNLKVKAEFPGEKILKTLEYRSKIEADDSVRIVTVGDIDACACCAPHVSRTGEIGLIKILDFMKHRGGTRIWMVAGKRALLDYRSKYDNVKRISAMLCAPQPETADTLENYIKDSENAKLNLKAARIKIAELEAEGVNEINGNAVFLLSDFTIQELIAFSNIAGEKISGITVALSGNDGDYKYVISSKSVDLRSISKEINSTLSGRGGGRPEMIQGSFGASFKEIQDYFK
jgi:alanyl-tRNA synthetase